MIPILLSWSTPMDRMTAFEPGGGQAATGIRRKASPHVAGCGLALEPGHTTGGATVARRVPFPIGD